MTTGAGTLEQPLRAIINTLNTRRKPAWLMTLLANQIISMIFYRCVVALFLTL